MMINNNNDNNNNIKLHYNGWAICGSTFKNMLFYWREKKSLLLNVYLGRGCFHKTDAAAPHDILCHLYRKACVWVYERERVCVTVCIYMCVCGGGGGGEGGSSCMDISLCSSVCMAWEEHEILYISLFKILHANILTHNTVTSYKYRSTVFDIYIVLWWKRCNSGI